MTKKSIWTLTSVACDYDQPPNNLEAWWSEQPTIEQLTKVIYPHVTVLDDLLAGLNDLRDNGYLDIPGCVTYSLFQWLEED